jgi:exosortase
MQKGKSSLAIGETSYPFHLDLFGSRRWTLRIGFLIALFLFLYAPVSMSLMKAWWARDDYSHGFLVPFISLYLIWYRWERVDQLQVQPALLSGLSVIMAAGIMLLFGDAGGVITLQALSFVVMVAGLVLCLLGRDYLKALSFPIAYLLFMIPIADYLLAPLHWNFQLMAAKMGVGILQTLGFAVYLENQFIVLPHITLEVAKACSGINYLISIIAIGIPLAYVTQKNVWCRFVLVVSAVMIGVIANWVRVAGIGIWAYYGGEVLHGPFHIFQGLFVAQLGFISLFAGAWLLAKIKVPCSLPEGAHFSQGKAVSGKRDPKYQNLFSSRSWFAAVLTLAGLLGYLSFQDRHPVSLKEELTLFPLTIESW